MKWVLGLVSLIGFSFIYLPLVVVLINSFNADRTFSWPPTGFTFEWYQRMVANEGLREALMTSVSVGLLAALIAVILGMLLSFGVARYEFFGKQTISLLVVMPIALPGIVTGIALNSVFVNYFGGLTYFTIVVGHATFCIVIVYNNVVARLRRLGTNAEEASMDLGATRWTTFRLVTFPQMRSALVAGAILAFGLSFDEIVVTTFTAGAESQTLPIWIFNNLFRPNQAPVVNAVAATLVLISIAPVYVASRLSGDVSSGAGRL